LIGSGAVVGVSTIDCEIDKSPRSLANQTDANHRAAIAVMGDHVEVVNVGADGRTTQEPSCR
jgi:hypothetical protein